MDPASRSPIYEANDSGCPYAPNIIGRISPDFLNKLQAYSNGPVLPGVGMSQIRCGKYNVGGIAARMSEIIALTCSRKCPRLKVRVRSIEETDDEAQPVQRRTDHKLKSKFLDPLIELTSSSR